MPGAWPSGASVRIIPDLIRDPADNRRPIVSAMLQKRDRGAAIFARAPCRSLSFL
jgi:hypothetical protein